MAAFQYTGYRTLIYFKYLDRGAGHTLVADPGGQYDIVATESDLAVPPGDGRWIPVPPPAPEPEPEVKPVKSGKGNLSVSDAPVAVPDLIKPEVKPESEPEPSDDA